jgi:hypothetical protein
MTTTARALLWIAIAISALMLAACSRDVPPLGCEDPDFNCYMRQAIAGMTVVRENISIWSNWSRALQIASVVCSIVATIVIALQTDQNRNWTRPIGLVASALVTGIASAVTTFHMDENVDRNVEVLERMANITNDFGFKTDELTAGRTLEELKSAHKNNAEFRDKSNKITKEFVDSYNKVKIDMLKLSGASAKLKSVPAPVPQQSPAAPAKEDSQPKKKAP